MAVYTDVSLDALNHFLSDYDIGTARSFKGIAEGVENSNYFLETTDIRAILTLYEKRINADDLPYYLSIMAHLAAKGLPAPLPIKDKAGKALKTLMNRPACVISFLSGVSTDTPSTRQCYRVGKALAEMHQALADFDQNKPNDFSTTNWQSMIMATQDDCSNSHHQNMHRELVQEMAYLEGNWPEDNQLPVGTIHGDLFPDNVLFTGDSVSGLIDFYFACTDTLAYDLAIMITAWCFDSRQNFMAAHASALARGYGEIRPLTDTEKSMMTILCRGACLRFTLTRLVDWFIDVDGAVVKKKNPEDFFKRLQFFQSVQEDILWQNPS